MRIVVVASLLLGACAGTSSFIPLAKVEHTDAARYADEDAVIQQRDIELRVGVHRFSQRSYTRYAVLRSAGTSVAKIDVAIPPYGALVFLRARSIGPQGDVHTLSSKDIFNGAQTGTVVPAISWARAQVPSVEVGSVVEVEYELEYQHRLLNEEDIPLDAKFPIEREDVTLVVNENTSSKLIMKNADVPVTNEKGNDTHISRFELANLPAYRAEPYAPPDRLVRPHVEFQLSSAAGRAQNHDWNAKLRDAAQRLYGKGSLEADLVPPPSGPGDVQAFLARATAFVAARTDLADRSYSDRSRSAHEILLSHTATSTEKAVLLRMLLDYAHVVAHFAVVGNSPGDLDPSSPQTSRLGHLLVVVPVQPGIDSITNIDPSCESCAVGELPSWTERATNAPVDAIEFWLEGQAMRAARLHIEGGTVRPDSLVRAWDLEIDPQGAATIQLAVEERGDAAVRQATLIRTLDPKRRKALSALVATTVLPSAKVVGVKMPVYDKRTGQVSLGARANMAGFATVSGDHMIVPLSMLASLAPKSTRPRRAPVYIPHDSTTRDRVTLHIPSGWMIDELPAPRVATAPGFQLAVKVDTTGDTVTVQDSIDLTAGDYPREPYEQIARAAEEGLSLHGGSSVLKRK